MKELMMRGRVKFLRVMELVVRWVRLLVRLGRVRRYFLMVRWKVFWVLRLVGIGW